MALSNSEKQAAFRLRKRVLAMAEAAKNCLPPVLPKYAKDLTEAPALPPSEVVFDSVICDWLTISHPLREAHPVVNDGQILRIKADGTTEWITECWKTLKCASSDTSLRIKCDGEKVMMTGNIGRFGQLDNLNGHTVAECIELWRQLLATYYPNITDFFGPDFKMVNRITGEVQLSGTRITRCDLAGNFFTDNFASLTQMLMTRKLGQRPPKPGKFGPMWGYDSKRANWLKAKVYDKACELEGRRIPATGATTARFEVQLGSEILKRKGLHIADGWTKEIDMENVTFLEYSNQVFRDQATAESWLDIPPRIRQYAVLWRDGTPLQNQCKTKSHFYTIRKRLLEYGIDASQPCNVMTLVRRIEVVKVMPLPARRAA
ncbi:MAG: phage/plasmid replication protein [Gallionella sp.]|nr:phage/plasmid replication protein [Gallionella sp.]